MKQTQINNSFATMLNELRSGTAADELSEKLSELVAAVREAGKTGTLTFKLKVAPWQTGDGSKLSITDTISIAPPRMATPATLFFSDEENQLQRNDPNQRELELKTVEMTPKAVVKEVHAVAKAS